MYWMIRFALIAIFVICAVLLLKRFRAKLTKFRKALVIVVTLCICAVIEFLPVENWIVNFSTPEAAFSYVYSEEPLEIINGSESTLVIGEDSMVVTLAKSEKGWKCPTIGGVRFFLRGYSESYYITVFRHGNTDDYYVCVMHAGGKELAVTDFNNTGFVKVKRTDTPVEYYGYVHGLNEQYKIIIDEKEFTLSEFN